jgi:hypothetical protein
LEVRTTTLKRTLVPSVAVLDFGEIPVKVRTIKEIYIKNEGSRPENLKLDSLTMFGGFSVLNAMRTVMPGEIKPVVV